MVTDKLRIIGDSRSQVAGKKGAVKPKAKLEDPFKDDAPLSTTEAAAKGSTEVPTTVPAKAGRSRLILQPKKKKAD